MPSVRTKFQNTMANLLKWRQRYEFSCYQIDWEQNFWPSHVAPAELHWFLNTLQKILKSCNQRKCPNKENIICWKCVGINTDFTTFSVKMIAVLFQNPEVLVLAAEISERLQDLIDNFSSCRRNQTSIIFSLKKFST